MNSNWLKDNKYTLKANWLDSSQLRSVITGKLSGQAFNQDTSVTDELNKVFNAGHQDGFQIVLYQNNIFQGVYTLNVKKGNTQLTTSEKVEPKAIISANEPWGCCGFYEKINENFSNGWEIEDNAKDFTQEQIRTSFNNFIDCVTTKSGQELLDVLPAYTNIDRILDYLVVGETLHCNDNVTKNQLWATYDGVKWIPVLYDLDNSFGLKWETIEEAPTATTDWSTNNLFTKILNLKADDYKAKYNTFRTQSLSETNIDSVIDEYFALFPQITKTSEWEKWTARPSAKLSTAEFMKNWIKARLEFLDNKYKA